MDRGLSTHMVGRGLRWSDILALMKNLGHTSHLRRLKDPKGCQRAEMLEVSNQLMGLIADRVEQSMWTLSGRADGAPQKDTVTRILDEFMTDTPDNPVAPRRRELSAAQARELVARAYG